MTRSSLLLVIAALCYAASLFALEPHEYALALNVQTRQSPPGIVLSWPGDAYAREHIISRKLPGEQTWQQIAVLPGNITSFTDANVTGGQVYEYEIVKHTSHFPYPNGNPSDWSTAYAYAAAALNGTFPDYLGKVILVVDSSVAAPLAGELTQFAQDLTGDGWLVVRRDVSRSSSVQSVKDLIRAEYNADPAHVRSVILFGHIPVPYSGAINPDMHRGHLGAWPADVYYAELDGNWTDNSVNVTSGWYAENHNVPGDGKFDQSEIPGTVELEIGRIDFFNMPAFQPRSEIDLLRAYLRKNHEFRHGLFSLPRRGLIRDNFGDLSGDAPAVDAWRHYPVFFGPDQFREVGPNAFFSTLENEGFLWSYAGGGGDYKSLDAVGSTSDFATRNPRSAFLILHGSYFGDWDNEDNFLRAAIAGPNYTLAAIWSGLPHWFMHHMALGEPIGYSTRLTQNNRGLYKSNQNFSTGEVHIALMGDPTLRMFPVAPPKNLRAQVGDTVNLSWDPSIDPSVTGYHVYHSSSANGRYERLTGRYLTTTSYSHTAGQGLHHYMVRAIKLETTGSGTFYNPSQGALLSVNKDTGVQPPTVRLLVLDDFAAELGPDNAVLQIERIPAGTSPLQVQLTIGGTAQNGSDYQSLPSIFTIPAGSSSVAIDLVPLQDIIAEGNETVEMGLAPSSAYLIGSPAAASLVIIDNQPNERPTISEISDIAIARNTSTPELPFAISDKETPAETLQVSASSADKALLPDYNLILGGSGTTRTIKATPLANQTGTAKITVTVSDGQLEASRNFFVTVTNVNLPPLVQDHEVATDEDTDLPITLTASDPEGAPLAYSVVQAPENGTLSGMPPSLTYTPAKDFHGQDSFIIEVSDGSKTASAVVNITVNPVNDAPLAAPQSLDLAEDSTISIELGGADLEGSDLHFLIVADPEHGSLTGTPPLLTYTPHPNFFGEDSFEFAVSDGMNESAPASVTLSVLPVNDPPKALAQTLTVLEDDSLAVILAGSDLEESSLTFQVLTAPSSGTLTGDAPELLYQPGTNFHGSDFFTFRVNDSETSSPPATVEITITPIDDPPSFSAPAQFAIRKNSDTGPIPILLSDVDTPATNLVLSAASLSPGIVDSADLLISGSGANRTLVATPLPDMLGMASIRLTVADAANHTTAILTLTVTNTPPIAKNDTLERTHGTFTVPVAAILSNDSDPDGDAVTILAVTSPTAQGGSITLLSGSAIYVPPQGLLVNDQFTYTIKDSSGDTARATVTLTPPGAPRFTAIEKSSSGVLLRFSGLPGETFLITASSDTQQWNLLAEVVTDSTGKAQFEDSNSGAMLRFYRIEKK